jgi:hypothetical protein
VQVEFIKIWGLKRTGTNWLRWLIDANFKSVETLMDVMGWKHGTPTRKPSWNWRDWYPEWCPHSCPIDDEKLNRLVTAWEDGRIGHVMIIKNPLSWIDSMIRYLNCAHAAMTLEWLRLHGEHWASRLGEFEQFTRAGVGQDALIIRYEDLIKSKEPAMALEPLAVAFELQRVFPPTDSTLHFERGNDAIPSDKCIRDPKKVCDRSYWTELAYVSNFHSDQIALLRSTIPSDLLQRWGYEL